MQLHKSVQVIPFIKHSQYIFKHFDFLQLPFLINLFKFLIIKYILFYLHDLFLIVNSVLSSVFIYL